MFKKKKKAQADRVTVAIYQGLPMYLTVFFPVTKEKGDLSSLTNENRLRESHQTNNCVTLAGEGGVLEMPYPVGGCQPPVTSGEA